MNFAWADLDVTPDARRQDLQNALTHEMGHFIGLDHTCYQPGTVSSPPLDNNGNPIPTCDNASDDVRATTMFASAPPGDTQKRTLEADDCQAVCDIYPTARDPANCPALDNGQTGCACAVGDATSAGWHERLPPAALAMVLAGLWFARARRNPRRRDGRPAPPTEHAHARGERRPRLAARGESLRVAETGGAGPSAASPLA